MPIINIKECLNCSGKDNPVDHSWVFDGISLKELRLIKKVTGMSQVEFAKAGDEGDPDALAALLFIMHLRDKIRLPFEDVDLDFSKFEMVMTEQEQREYDLAEAAEKAALEADPKDD